MILKKSNKFLALIFIFKALAFSTDVPYSVSDTGTYENFVYLSQRIDVISKSISSSSTTISYPISVANGGTGATTASGARSHLEVPSLTGTGASGTWSINITGSANSANTANSSNSSLTASTASYSNYASTAGYAPGDNLGNHIATMTITANYGISASTISVSSITASGSIAANTYYGDGSHLTGISGSGGDNLGNHIATMTLTTNYGINTSTIQTKNILVYDPVSQPYINILSLNYLNSPEIRFSTTATNSSWSIGNMNTWNDALVFKQKGLNGKMILTQDGKLSIGVNPYPTEKLEVSGNVKADSFINTTQGTINYIVVSTALYSMNGGSGSGGDVYLASTQTFTGKNTFNNNTIFNSSITINANTSQQYALTIDSNSNTSDGYIVSIDTVGHIISPYEYEIIYASYPSYYGSYVDISSFTINIPAKYRHNGVNLLLEIEGAKLVNMGDLVAYFNSDNSSTKYLTIHKAYVHTGVVWGSTPVDIKPAYFLLTTNDFNVEQRTIIKAEFNYNHGWILYSCRTIYAGGGRYGQVEFGGGYSSSAPQSITIHANGSQVYSMYKLVLKAKLF